MLRELKDKNFTRLDRFTLSSLITDCDDKMVYTLENIKYMLNNNKVSSSYVNKITGFNLFENLTRRIVCPEANLSHGIYVLFSNIINMRFIVADKNFTNEKYMVLKYVKITSKNESGDNTSMTDMYTVSYIISPDIADYPGCLLNLFYNIIDTYMMRNFDDMSKEYDYNTHLSNINLNITEYDSYTYSTMCIYIITLIRYMDKIFNLRYNDRDDIYNVLKMGDTNILDTEFTNLYNYAIENSSFTSEFDDLVSALFIGRFGE